MTITVSGTTVGLVNVAVNIESLEVTYSGGRGFILNREMVETALKNEGLTLQPLKCSREKEGASYGNLVDAVKAPGKTASGLWWMWQSPQHTARTAARHPLPPRGHGRGGVSGVTVRLRS